MSMLVRKGTMLHRASTRRHNRRRSLAAGAAAGAAAADRRERSGSLATPTMGATGSSLPRRPMAPAIPGTSSVRDIPLTVNVAATRLVPTHRAATCLSQDESRRSSSVASRLSADDRKALFATGRRHRGDVESGVSRRYGSTWHQLKDANRESSGCCDFLSRALDFLGKTVVVSVFYLGCFLLALLMVIFGTQYLRDCPLEPNIPLYLLVGGCVGLLKAGCLLWHQHQSRRYERLDDEDEAFSLSDDDVSGGVSSGTSSASDRVSQAALSLFLLGWFAAGNYWTWRVYRPRAIPPVLEPRNWCHATLYSFLLGHLYLCHATFVAFLLLLLLLTAARRLGCF